MTLTPSRKRAGLWACIATFIAGCATQTEPPRQPSPPVSPAPIPMPTPAPTPTPTPPQPKMSDARVPRDYRRDAASHLYEKNRARIYPGKLPPLLYAVGVLDVDINAQGNVTGLHWIRAPRQAPEVVREIERTVYEAAPYPRPHRMGKVTYTDTWLWDASGRFQLDTLSEGQL